MTPESNRLLSGVNSSCSVDDNDVATQRSIDTMTPRKTTTMSANDVTQQSSIETTTPRKTTTMSANDVNATVNYITIEFIGRLGNRMFQYAALMGLARLTQRTPLVVCDGILTSKYPLIAAECLRRESGGEMFRRASERKQTKNQR